MLSNFVCYELILLVKILLSIIIKTDGNNSHSQITAQGQWSCSPIFIFCQIISEVIVILWGRFRLVICGHRLRIVIFLFNIILVGMTQYDLCAWSVCLICLALITPVCRRDVSVTALELGNDVIAVCARQWLALHNYISLLFRHSSTLRQAYSGIWVHDTMATLLFV